jgi:hypothetical protein
MQLNAVESSVVIRALVQHAIMVETITGFKSEPVKISPATKTSRKRAAKKGGKKGGKKANRARAAKVLARVEKAALGKGVAPLQRELDNVVRHLVASRPSPQTRRRTPQNLESVKGGETARGAKKASKAAGK